MAKKRIRPWWEVADEELDGKCKIGRPEDQRPGNWITRSRNPDTLEFLKEKRDEYKARIKAYGGDTDALWAIALLNTLLEQGEVEVGVAMKEFRQRTDTDQRISDQRMHTRFAILQDYCRNGRNTRISQGIDPRKREPVPRLLIDL